MSVLYINNDTIFKVENNEINKIDSLIVSKNDIITSSISLKDIISYTLKLPSSMSEEQLITEAEIQFYENAGLDLNKKYITKFITKKLEDESVYLIEAIAVSEEVLHQKFDSIISNTKYIDFISFSLFSFSEFYDLHKKEAANDVFVYLDQNQSFLAVFKDKEYLYSKPLPSLNLLLKQLDVSYENFVELISKKGLIADNYSDEEFFTANNIEKFFYDYFIGINNRISHGKNLFNLKSIDNIYFYAPFDILGIDHTIESIWDLHDVSFHHLPKDEHFLDKLTAIYNAKHYEDNINFSIFPRPPKIYQLKTFQLAMVILVTLAVFLGDFGYRYYQNMQLENKYNKLEKTIKLKSQKLKQLELINKMVLKKIHMYQEEIKSIESKIDLIKQILQKSIEITDIPKTSTHFIIFSELLRKNNLRTFLISKNGEEFSIGVYTKSTNREAIGMFMEDLANKGYKNITTNKISTINDNYYMSIIRFTK